MASERKKAIILLSGGLDSTVMLALAKSQNKECYALTFDYGQRHHIEIEAAKKIAQYYQVPHQIVHIDSAQFASSALITKEKEIPKNRTETEMQSGEIPSTYVPARNILFLSYALGYAELWQTNEIHIGINALDRLPYPDCRPEFVQAFQHVADIATKSGLEGYGSKIVTPVTHMTKQEIIALGKRLEAPLEMTFSCYDPTSTGEPCLQCDACLLRQ